MKSDRRTVDMPKPAQVIVNADDTTTRLSRLLDDVECGAGVVIGRDGHPVDRLVAASPGPDAVFPSYAGTMTAEFTAVFQEVPEGYIAFVEELPGANSQGRTLEEARQNLHEAVELVLTANRELSNESVEGQSVIREPLRITA